MRESVVEARSRENSSVSSALKLLTSCGIALLALVFPACLNAQNPPQNLHAPTVWDPNTLIPHGGPLTPVSQAPPLSTTTWTPIGPAPISNGQRPGGGVVSGRVTGIAADPANANIIYVAAAGGGVWRTTDGGANWSPRTDSVRTAMGAIAVAPNNGQVIYAATGEANNSADSQSGGEFLISTDGGTSWTGSIIAPWGARHAVSEIAVDPTNANIVYVAVSYGIENGVGGNTGIWKSTNGGSTWTNTTTPITSTYPWTSVRVDPSTPTTLYAAVGYAFGNAANGVYKSTNSGSTWTLLSGAPNGSGTGRIVVAVSKSNSSVIYMTDVSPSTFALSKIERSDNGGTTWTDLTSGIPNYVGGQGWYDTTLIVDPTNSAIVYVAGSAGTNSVLQSTNSGVSWTDISTGTGGVGPHVDHHAATFDANGKFLDGDDGGIYRYDPSTTTWTQLNGTTSYLNTIQFQGIALHPTNMNIVLGGSQDNGTEMYSGTLSWTLVEGGDGGLVKFSHTNSSRVYHQSPVASFGPTAFFRRSDDGGMTWTSQVTGITDTSAQNFYAPFVVDPGNGDRVLFGGAHVWETTNGGTSWTALGAAFPNNVNAIGLAPSDVNTIYAALSGGSVYVTTNHGTTWTLHSLPVTGTVSDIQVHPTNPQIALAAIGTYVSAGSNVYKTTNGGTAWTDIGGGSPHIPTWTIQIDPNAPNTNYYVGHDLGVSATTNGGTTWSDISSGSFGLPAVQVFQLELNSTLGVLGAATHGRGAWELQAGVTFPTPTIVSLTPINGSGNGPTTFTATVADTSGNADIGLVYLLFNSSLSVRYGCLVAYDNTNNLLLLYNDTGSGLVSGTLTPGVAGTLSNTRCTINGTGASVIPSGNNLAVAVPITFSGAFVGTNTQYLDVVSKEQKASGFVAEGTWTGNTDVAPTIPTGQFSGTGNPQTFSFQFNDSTSGENIALAYVIFGENLTLNNGCTVAYSAGLGVVYLLNDAGTGLAGSITPGVAGTAANSQCTIASGGTTSVTGPTLTVPLNITFTARFGGQKGGWGYALSATGLNSGFVQMGTWSAAANVAPGTPTAPAPTGSGNGPYMFTLTYSDANGYLDLEDTYLLISSTGTGVNACEVVYAPAYNAAFLLNDAGTAFVSGIMTPGSGGTISNTHCSVTNAGAPSNNGTTNLTVPFQITFASFTGTKTYYGQAIDASGAASAFQSLGTITLP